MKWQAAILFLIPSMSVACLPHEVYVRSHQVSSHRRSDGTAVKEYNRSGHCRELVRTNFYRDTTSQNFKSISPKLKKWTEGEKSVLNKTLSDLPPWLAKYALSEALRAETDGTINPAASIPYTKTLIIYDSFFKASDKRSIIIHEISHVAIWDLDVRDIEEFADLSGWTIKRENNSIKRTPPKKLLLPDSSENISEDFANHIEVFYARPTQLKIHNAKAYDFIEKLIKKKEKP